MDVVQATDCWDVQLAGTWNAAAEQANNSGIGWDGESAARGGGGVAGSGRAGLQLAGPRQGVGPAANQALRTGFDQNLVGTGST